MRLIILTPEKQILDMDINQVTVPTLSGQVTILPNHTNLISALSLGNVFIIPADSSSQDLVTIESGFLTTNGKDIKILADVAIHEKGVEESEVERIKLEAEQIMKDAPADRNIEKLKAQVRVAELHLVSRRRRKV